MSSGYGLNPICLRMCAVSKERTIGESLSGIVHVLKSGCRWCDCPEAYGPPTTIYNRFVRWARRGVWEALFRELARSGRSTGLQMIDQRMSKRTDRQRVKKGGAETGCRPLARRA
jgi:transposase